MNDTRAAGPFVDVLNPSGRGACLVVCEHASNAIPAGYDDLGLEPNVLSSHIAWDPGAIGVAREMSARLDAPLVAQKVSRLLYDCNRPPHDPSAVPVVSEIYEVPGNAGLSERQRDERAQRFYAPFRAALAAAIDARPAPPVIVTVHSFTPVYHGARRDVEIGILHDADARLADAMLSAAGQGGGFVVRRNEPYGPRDGVTHTLREHALPRGLLNVMIEIRNDLIADEERQTAMAATLCAWLNPALDVLGRAPQREASA